MEAATFHNPLKHHPDIVPEPDLTSSQYLSKAGSVLQWVCSKKNQELQEVASVDQKEKHSSLWTRAVKHNRVIHSLCFFYRELPSSKTDIQYLSVITRGSNDTTVLPLCFGKFYILTIEFAIMVTLSW